MISLKTTLLINGISSAATGVLLVLLDRPIAGLFAVTNPHPFTGTGFFLIVFGAFVLIISLQQPVNPQALSLIILLDALWVVVSVLSVFWLFSSISLTGSIAIVAVAGWASVMAFLQNKGMKN